MNSELVAIAKITKPHGLRGEVTAEILTDFPERFNNLVRVFTVSEPERTLELKIERHRFHKNRIILKFAGQDSIESVEKFRNLVLYVPESETVDLEEGSYFDWDLEGCQVVNMDGDKIGDVKGIFRAGENENLIVQGSEKEHLIPFVKAICTDVSIEDKLIKVDLPEGLLEF